MIKLLPDGLLKLLAPAAALPALMFAEGAADPLMPVVVPLDVDPLVAPPLVAPPPVKPPLCARAALAVRASAVASPSVASFIRVSS